VFGSVCVCVCGCVGVGVGVGVGVVCVCVCVCERERERERERIYLLATLAGRRRHASLCVIITVVNKKRKRSDFWTDVNSFASTNPPHARRC